MLLRQADRRLGLTRALAEVLPDPRDPALITHSLADLLRQRIYGLALGYEDLNDHDTLRHDLAWQTAVERDEPLASSPTLCRLEAQVDRATAAAFHGVLVEQFIASFAREGQRSWCWTSMRPMTGCMASRRAGSSTVTMGIGVSCRSTSFAGSSCWSLTCARVTSMRPGMRGRS